MSWRTASSASMFECRSEMRAAFFWLMDTPCSLSPGEGKSRSAAVHLVEIGQHLRDRLVEDGRDQVAEVELHEHLREVGVAMDGDVVRLREAEDLLRDLAPPFRHHARSIVLRMDVFQRHRHLPIA